MSVRVFLSYRNAQHDFARELYLTLSNVGYSVFFDRADLEVGREYNRRIKEEIRSSDVMIFLISPQAVEMGAYTLTELKWAEAMWPHPVGRIVPVMVEETRASLIPAYIRSVTILRPAGNAFAETAIAVERLIAGEGFTPLATQIEEIRQAQIDARERDEHRMLGLRLNKALVDAQLRWEEEKKARDEAPGFGCGFLVLALAALPDVSTAFEVSCWIIGGILVIGSWHQSSSVRKAEHEFEDAKRDLEAYS